MENLWAPWRMRYIEKADVAEGCIFCDKPAQDTDKENLLLFRGNKAFVIMNKYPYNNGHLMIVPYRHISDLNEITDEEFLEINQLTKVCHNGLAKVLKAQGFNIGANLGRIAGAGIDAHIHYHIVPRWSGDTNFMPVIGQTKVISQAMEETYDKLFHFLNGDKS